MRRHGSNTLRRNTPALGIVAAWRQGYEPFGHSLARYGCGTRLLRPHTFNFLVAFTKCFILLPQLLQAPHENLLGIMQVGLDRFPCNIWTCRFHVYRRVCRSCLVPLYGQCGRRKCRGSRHRYLYRLRRSWNDQCAASLRGSTRQDDGRSHRRRILHGDRIRR